MIAPNAFEEVLQAFGIPASLCSRGVHTAVVIFDNERAWQIVGFDEHGRLVEMSFLFAAVTDETPNMMIRKRVDCYPIKPVFGLYDLAFTTFLYRPRNTSRNSAASSKNRAAYEIVLSRIDEHRIA